MPKNLSYTYYIWELTFHWPHWIPDSAAFTRIRNCSPTIYKNIKQTPKPSTSGEEFEIIMNLTTFWKGCRINFGSILKPRILKVAKNNYQRGKGLKYITPTNMILYNTNIIYITESNVVSLTNIFMGGPEIYVIMKLTLH